MELAIYRNRTYCESPLVPKFCYLAFAFILFKSSCSLHFRSTFSFFYQGTDSFIEHPKIVFCSEYFRHTHSHIILTLYENVWSLNGINIFCWLHTSVYYSIFFVWLLLLVVFGYFVCGLRHFCFCFCSSFHLFSFFNQSIEHFTRNHLWIVHTTCLKRFSFCTQFAFQFNTVIERDRGR